MKLLLLSLFILTATLELMATENEYVACTNDPHEYNVLMVIQSNKVISYAVNDSAWSEEIEITSEDHDMGVLWMEWAMMNDTRFGYSVYLDKDLLNNWKVKSWTAGNDSDNYQEVENDEPVLCHQLKSKPKSTAIRANNVLRVLQDF